ncbi:MAG TPA: sugar phosphate nucleotidyltransferase [Pirellulales bacterium]
MLYAVVMAGGSGTRFWPESRSARPKQLLNLVGERTMIQATIDRLTGLAAPEHTLIVTSAALVDELRKQLPQLPAHAFIGEPCRRDTAPAIALAALRIARSDPHGVMMVLPADHVIESQDAFQSAIRQAESLVASAPGRIVTFGIRPTYPAESFGYIERGESLEVAGAPTYAVKRFHEKPKVELARQYVAAGNFYWNSGMFVWSVAKILAALDYREPDMMAHLRAIVAVENRPDYQEVFAREFGQVRPISIDYAVMEHACDVLVIEAPFSWDDVGSWQAIARLQGADEHGNTSSGRHLSAHSTGNIVRSTEGHLVVTLGVRDLIIVHTPDATLVANKNDEESIRQLVEMIGERGWREHL